jgi:3-oxoacyl-[acyl-carrier-protein] synthase III
LTRVGIAGTAAYLPERVMTAADVAAASGIPEDVIVEKFGLRSKHVAASDEHVSDLSLRAGAALLQELELDPASIDVVMYYGSTWKDYAVWQVSPLIAHELGCTNAVALEFDNVSHGTPIALRVARDLLRAEDELQRILVVAACRESYLLDYTNQRSRFMFNFGDGAVAGLLVRDANRNELLGCDAFTDGSLSLQVKVQHGGSVSSSDGYPFLDVDDPTTMKERLDRVSLENFVRVAQGALERSGAGLGDVAYLCGIHMKPSMHNALLGALGMEPGRAAYLDDTGHMSGVDPLLALDRAGRDDLLREGDLVLLLAAGTGYTWAASVVRWGRSELLR